MACTSCCSGAGGYIVATLPRPVREKVRPARLDVGVSAKKFALHAQNGRKTLFSGALGEFFRGDAAIGPCWASYFAEKSLEGLCWANFVARADRDGAWRVQLEPE